MLSQTQCLQTPETAPLHLHCQFPHPHHHYHHCRLQAQSFPFADWLAARKTSTFGSCLPRPSVWPCSFWFCVFALLVEPEASLALWWGQQAFLFWVLSSLQHLTLVFQGLECGLVSFSFAPLSFNSSLDPSSPRGGLSYCSLAPSTSQPEVTKKAFMTDADWRFGNWTTFQSLLVLA